MQHHEIEPLIKVMANNIESQLLIGQKENPVMIGIHTGGVWIANRLKTMLAIDEPLGELNIAFYRDDFTKIGIHPEVKPSCLPFEVEGRHIILVDDVLQSGRTIRAAWNEIFDYGRPASVMLVVLVERGGRELPIQADVAGMKMDLPANQHIKLSGPEQLNLKTIVVEK